MPIRPVVLVFQEVANPTVSPTIPDLNCFVVGPAYWIQDYFVPGVTPLTYADKFTDATGATPQILVGTGVYGQLEGALNTTPPVGNTGGPLSTEPPNNKPGAVLDDNSVVVYFDLARAVVASGTMGTTVVNSNLFSISDSIDWSTGVNKVIPGDRILVSDGSNTKVHTVYSVDTALTLHFSDDATSVGFTPGSGQAWRVERQVNDVPIDASFFVVNGNTTQVKGGVTISVNGAAKTVTYAKVYMAYRTLRQDLQVLDTVAQESDIITKIGRIDARNPLAVGVNTALVNTTTVVQFAGVPTDDILGHETIRDRLTSRSDLYAIVPLTTDVPTLKMWNDDCVGRADPLLAESLGGRPQRFRVVLGSGVLSTTQTLAQPSAAGVTSVLTSSSPGTIAKITLTGIASLVSAGVIPGDILHITVTSDVTKVVTGDYPIAQVLSALIVNVNGTTPFASAGTANITASILKADGVSVRVASAPLTAVVTAAVGDLYLTLADANGTFVTSGIISGDIIEMPHDGISADFTTGLSKFVVATVLSEQRLLIVNNGSNTSTTENELPHAVSWATPPTSLGAGPTYTGLNYQIVRNMSKDQQVTDLIALSTGFKSKRMVLVWPDLVDVAGAVGGTSQPGYYLSCAVGGMTAGLPSHQGFTFLGIGGISEIYHSNTYFSDQQLTDLSNGGWFVFAQQTSTSLPFCVHQLTTDTSTLESGEYSVVKNFDFVSVFFVDILEQFLGSYNVTPETLVFMRLALSTGGDVLKARQYPKIGATISSFAISDLAVSDTQGDRVITHLAIGLPKPLNVVELHLVA